MKQLLLGIALIVLLGIAGFLYRNVMEHPRPMLITDAAQVHTPPRTDMAVEGLTYVLPSGFSADEHAIGAEPTLRAAFVASSTETIMIRDYPIPDGKKAEDVMLSSTQYQTSGKVAKSMKELSTLLINGQTFYSVVLERFEGQVHTAYYLPRTTDVLRFEAIDTGVANWTDSKLDVTTLPAQSALRQMLTTLEVTKQ